jgi:hypothetical protein
MHEIATVRAVAAVELAAGFRAAHHQDAQVCTPYRAQYALLSD